MKRVCSYTALWPSATADMENNDHGFGRIDELPNTTTQLHLQRRASTYFVALPFIDRPAISILKIENESNHDSPTLLFFRYRDKFYRIYLYWTTEDWCEPCVAVFVISAATRQTSQVLSEQGIQNRIQVIAVP